MSDPKGSYSINGVSVEALGVVSPDALTDPTLWPIEEIAGYNYRHVMFADPRTGEQRYPAFFANAASTDLLNSEGEVIPLSGGVSGLTINSQVAATANTAAINAMLALGGYVLLNAGGVVYINDHLLIPSNTHVHVEAGTTLRRVDGSATLTVFLNSDTVGGNSNIQVTGGGVTDSNYANAAGGVSTVSLMGNRFTNVDGLVWDGPSVVNNLKYGIHLTACSDFRVSNVNFNTVSVGGDGVHVHGGSRNGLIENITGVCGDDVVALNVRDVPFWLDPATGGVGDITDILIRNISGSTTAANSGNCVAVYGNTTGTSTAITAASWSAGIATVTCGAFFPAVNTFVTIASVVASGNNGYNGTFRVTASSAGSVSYEVTENPGTYTSGGGIQSCYQLSGITVEGVKPVLLNGGNLVNLATSPTASGNGAIADIVINDVRGTGTYSRMVYIAVPCGSLVGEKWRHTLSGGATSEMLYAEININIDNMQLSDLSNELTYTGGLGALIKVNSPCNRVQLTNGAFRITGSTSVFLFTGATASLPYLTLEINNITNSGGRAILEIGAGAFKFVGISNARTTGSLNLVRTASGTGAVNIALTNVQGDSLLGGNSFIESYGTGVCQITMFGFLAIGSGGWTVLRAVEANQVTYLHAAGVPNYSLGLNWLSGSPGAASLLYLNGADIRADVTLVQRLNGAIINNTNAAAGTLGAAGLVSCEGTAVNSWSRLRDPTLRY